MPIAQLQKVPKVTAFAVEATKELLPIIEAQEVHARFSSFDSETAWAVGSTIRQLFIDNYGEAYKAGKLGVVIKVELWGGVELFRTMVGNAPTVSPDNWVWATAKRNVVERHGKSSLRVGRELADKGRTPESRGLAFPAFACHGGGFPIWLQSAPAAPIGVILVSGLPQLEDHQLIVDAIIQCTSA